MSIEKVLVCIIASLFQSFAATIITLNQVKISDNFSRIKFFIPMFLYCVIGQLYIPNQIRFVLCILIIILIMKFILKERDKKIVLYSFNCGLLLVISEVIVSLILVSLGINSVKIVNNSIYNLFANIFISLLSILLINIPIIKKTTIKLKELFEKNDKLIKYLYIFLVILYLIVLKNGFEFLLKSNYYINILFIIGIVLVLTIIILNEFKYDQINEQNKQMLNYVTKYEKIITEKGKANHEFKNQLMVIRGYAQMNKPDKLLEYIDGVVEDSKKTHSSYLISQLNKFPDGGIKGLLYYKLSIMDDDKIKYDINVESGIKTKLKTLSAVEYKNITKILGVLLDNAIDASKQTKAKNIIISVAKEKFIVSFSIFNTYNGKLDFSKIGTGYTTKGQGHGYGLRLVKDIVDANDMFSIDNFIEDEYYVSKLSIKIQSKRNKK